MSTRPPPPAPDRATHVAVPGMRGRMGAVAQLGARPNLTGGLRAAVATVGPILAATALGLPGASWAGLAGFMTAVADKGGAYRTRAQTLSAVALTGASAAVIGGLVAERPALAVPAIFLWATLAALLRAFGAAAGVVGTPATVVFVVSLSSPVHGAGALLERGGLFLAGSAAAMALALLLWPMRAYRPARLALAECWRGLGEYAAAVASGGARDFARFRTGIEAARTTLAATRRGRLGESSRGERLLMLGEQADRTFAATTALAGALDAAEGTGDAREMEAARETAAAVSRLAAGLAPALEREQAPPPAPEFPEVDAGDDGHWLPRLA